MELNNKVPIVLSNSYGSGWYTNLRIRDKQLLFDKNLVELVLAKDYEAIQNYCQTIFPKISFTNIPKLRVEYIPEGSKFIITNYDGLEDVLLRDKVNWLVA